MDNEKIITNEEINIENKKIDVDEVIENAEATVEQFQALNNGRTIMVRYKKENMEAPKVHSFDVLKSKDDISFTGIGNKPLEDVSEQTLKYRQDLFDSAMDTKDFVRRLMNSAALKLVKTDPPKKHKKYTTQTRHYVVSEKIEKDFPNIPAFEIAMTGITNTSTILNYNVNIKFPENDLGIVEILLAYPNSMVHMFEKKIGINNKKKRKRR